MMHETLTQLVAREALKQVVQDAVVGAGNLRETGHSAGSAPSAAPAENQKAARRPLLPYGLVACNVRNAPLTGRSSAPFL